jgi:hypothetical protein
MKENKQELVDFLMWFDTVPTLKRIHHNLWDFFGNELTSEELIEHYIKMNKL